MSEGAAVLGRVVLITLDGVGIGALPDAADYGDEGADTLGHVIEACGGLALPVLRSLGLGNIPLVRSLAPVAQPRGAFGYMAERSAGKDTTTGHWELAGLIREEPFPTYPEGFPEELVEAFARQTGLRPLGNVAASGTEIIQRFGEEHCRTGRPILYTSADSVFQIAAHEEVIPVERLYEICRIARRLVDPYRIGRVIARPFLGDSAQSFARTPRRHDFSIPPTGQTLLDRLSAAQIPVVGVGKIRDIFAGRGVAVHHPSRSNSDGMQKTLQALGQLERGLVFTNLVDFDMLYGHRCDGPGFGRALEEFDRWLPSLLESLAETDLVVITADHGCDPFVGGTDHTREHIPLLLYGPCLGRGIDLGRRSSFADLAATLAERFGVKVDGGESFWSSLHPGGSD